MKSRRIRRLFDMPPSPAYIPRQEVTTGMGKEQCRRPLFPNILCLACFNVQRSTLRLRWGQHCRYSPIPHAPYPGYPIVYPKQALELHRGTVTINWSMVVVDIRRLYSTFLQQCSCMSPKPAPPAVLSPPALPFDSLSKRLRSRAKWASMGQCQ